MGTWLKGHNQYFDYKDITVRAPDIATDVGSAFENQILWIKAHGSQTFGCGDFSAS